MQDHEKLKVLIPHWIEHNQEHAQEFLRYLGAAGDGAADLENAAKQMELVNLALTSALQKIS